MDGGVTNIAVVLLIVELAATSNRLVRGRGRRGAILFLVICCAGVSCCARDKRQRI
jgi:hypothetical protein